MKTKALLAALLLCGCAATASAQSEGFRFGVTAGMNVCNITDQETDGRIGFNVGLRGEYNFTNSVYANAGLLFSQKGSKTEGELDILGYNVKGTYTETPGYIEIPVHVGYRYNLGNNVSIFGETGPYFAFGVAGKVKMDVNGHDEDVDFFSEDNGDPNAFDCGWGLRAGVEASGFQVHLGYDHGFTKVWDISGIKPKNSNFTVGLTYMF